MELEQVSIPAINRFASLYLKQEAPVTDFFHYQLTQEDSYINRVREIEGRTFMRKPLADCIETYMSSLPASTAVQNSLRKLREEQSTVVIGGQQAGLLTGPLYTIHKVISVLILAARKEKELKIPVVPVFWIAGEDHDFLEVNHVYIKNANKIEKLAYPERILEKRMISDIEFDHAQMKLWADKVLKTMEETEHTKDLLALIHEAIDGSQSMTDFFARLLHTLFSQYGLLLIDAAYPPLRKLERPFFKQLIEQAGEITDEVKKAQKMVSDYEFRPVIGLDHAAANIFIYENHERILLEYDRSSNRFYGKNQAVEYEKDELLHLLEEHPERFSNNVVTRPLMQEWLFPTLAFIAGPGEIAYWAELKQAFELLGMKMPPIQARLNITIAERHIAADLRDLAISLPQAVRNGVAAEREAFWSSIKDQHFHELIQSAQESLMKQYQAIEERAQNLHKGALPIINKNKEFHLQQFRFLERKTDSMLESKHQATLNKYDRIQQALKPAGSPQERIWNIFYYLNKYGLAFIEDLMKLDYSFTGDHQLIKV
ncbi:bacillithiol biosynthesis cysteine-adding enzyme BshC [Bacillus xiapuensis]|uniref:bacillithiol biosynthesis cysteine-adding enzyme BshC n=1 Tax=Bacillus xiapuensis TaxID=2014075 RepID=UPI000C2473A0|nr:bacillithiol biosynthesis cysteine-adding enzyme BshC [Bacillus xiapuensis]